MKECLKNRRETSGTYYGLVVTKYNQHMMWTVLILCLYIIVDRHTQVKIQTVWHGRSVDGRMVASSFAFSASSSPSGFLLGQIDPEDIGTVIDRNVGKYSPNDRPSHPRRLVSNQDHCENVKCCIVAGHQSPFVTSLT